MKCKENGKILLAFYSFGTYNQLHELNKDISEIRKGVFGMKMMKKIMALALALLMVAALCACGGSSGDSLTIEKGKLIMSTNAEFPPYEMTTDEGGYAGIDVEIAGEIAKKLGLELVIEDMGFDAALLAVQEGKSDIVMAGVSVTDDRLLVMDFSDSYATAKQVIIVKEGSAVTLDTLGDYIIGTQRATTGNIYCTEDYGEDHVKAYDNGATAVQALVNGQIDCVVIDSAPAEEYVASNPGLVILETEYVTEQYAIGMDKGNTALVEAVNKALAELIADGTVQSIIDKYISAN